MAIKTLEVSWARCAGRDGRALPTDLNDRGGMAEEAVNVSLNLDGLPSKRAGCGWFGIPVTLGKLAQYVGAVTVEGVSRTGEHLVMVTRGSPAEIYTSPMADLGGGLVLGAALSILDPILDPATMAFAQLNNKLFVAYDSAVNRLHVWDPSATGNVLRRVGLARPAAPTAVDVGSGSYAATLRYYRVRWISQVGGTTRRASEVGPAVVFTPSGSGSGVIVTRPAVPSNEYVTHWQVLGSVDDKTYYDISAPIATATTTFFDTTPPASYPDLYESADLVGLFTPWPSVKYLLAATDRLVGLGVWEPEANMGEGMAPVPGRIYFSRTLSSTSTDDDESVSNAVTLKGYIDIGRGLGYADRGLGGPIDAQILAFQSKGVYLLQPTGDADAPYRRLTITMEVGAIEGSIINAQDELGRPCVMWADETQGIFRYGAEGLQWCGYDLRDRWATFNRVAPEGLRCHACFNGETQEARFWVSFGTDTIPSTVLKFSARLGRPHGPTGVRYGWTIETGEFARARHSVSTRAPQFIVSRAFYTPFVTREMGGVLYMDSTKTADDTVPFAGYVKSKPLPIDPIYTNKNLVADFMYLQASALAGATIRCTLHRNYNEDAAAPYADVAIGPYGSQTRVVRRFESAHMEDAWALQVTLGDAAPVAAPWTLDVWMARLEVGNQEMGNRG